MNTTKAIEIIENHAHWRRCMDDGCDCSMGKPADTTQALDVLLKVAKKSLAPEKKKAVKK